VKLRRRQATADDPVLEAVVRYFASALIAVILISVLAVWLVRRSGEAEAIRDAKDQTRIAAKGTIEPVLSDGLLRGKATAIETVDRAVKEHVQADPEDDSIARIKIWDRSGRIVYYDEPRLIGRALGETEPRLETPRPERGPPVSTAGEGKERS
jgi:two-component system, NarL family, sensor kinase